MSTVEPVRKQLIVEASVDHAFKVSTDGIDRWWPRSHHIGKFDPGFVTEVEA